MADDTIQKLTDALLEKDNGTVLPIDLSTCYEYGMRGLCGTKCPDFGSKCECGEEVVMDNDGKYFVEQCKGMSAIEILNWYRNFYYAENHGTERRIVADAINEVIVKLGGSQ